MNKKILATIMSLALILPLLTTSTTLLHVASAQPETAVKVQPAENIFYTNTTSVGHTFKISIIAENIPEPGFYGWQVLLSWTPGLINCTAETINYAIWPYYMGPWVTDPINNIAGTYQQSLTGKAPSTPRTGTFWLVNLTFQIVQAPLNGQTLQTNLTISASPPSSYCLADKTATEIPHAFSHGVYKYISPRPPLPQISLKVKPSSILNPSLIPCTTFNVNVTVVNALYLHGFRLKLGYNQTVIECTEVEEGDLLAGFGATTMDYMIENDEGYTFVSINLTAPEAVADGNGTLATFTFHVLAIWDSVLHLYDTKIYDAEGGQLPHTTSDGYFNNVLMPKLYVDPPVIVDPSMVPGDEFQVEIKIAKVSDLYDYEFKLVYDTMVLTGLGILMYPFDGETSFDLQFYLNDTKGEIWVKVQYYPPAEPLTTIDPVTLVSLFFQVQSYGATWLHFNQSSLSDSSGLPITHIAQDGYVSVLRRDVAIESITPQFNEVYKGWKINITVVAKNLGDIPETFNVTLFVAGNEVGEQQVVGLAPNATTTVVFVFDTMQSWIVPCHNYTLSAEASQLPFEIDILNNFLEDGQIHVKMMGDINGDGAVNYYDAILAGTAFGTKPGDPNWNPNADLNCDNFVNYLDVIILGRNFGAVCTP
jgi:hypothetical protein